MKIRLARLVAVGVLGAVVALGATPAVAAAPKPDANGTIHFGQAGTTGYAFDPHIATSKNGYGTFTAVYDRLLHFGGDSRTLEPMLATGWKWDSTNTQLTFDLRKDVKFHDGTPFTADVAVQNIKRVAAAGSVGAVTLSTMTSAVAVDPATLKLTFSAPNPGVPYLFASFGGMMVSPAGLANPNLLKTQFFGSGAYKFTGVDGALTYSFDRNDAYWDKSYVYPAHMQILNINDENTRLNAVKTGALDATYITAQTYDSAKSDPSLQVVTFPAFGPFVVFMNNKIAPFDKLEVRQAVILGLNRDAANASQNGLCPPMGGVFPPGIDGYLPSLKPTTNVTKAKQMITDAGANGASAKIIVTSVEPYTTFGKVIQAQLGQIGLNVEVQLMASSISRQQFQAGQAPLLVSTSVPSSPDPGALLDQYVLGKDNPGTQDPILVGKIQAAEQLPVGKQRTAAFQDINKYMVQTNPLWAPFCDNTNIFVANKQVIGLKTMPEAALSLAPDNHYLQIAKSK